MLLKNDEPLSADDVDPHWNAVDIIEFVQQISPDEAEFLSSLIEVLNDQDKCPKLDSWEIWKRLLDC